MENRRYYNPVLKTTLWYFQWMGSEMKGHFDIERDIQPLGCMPGNCDETATKGLWKIKPWDFVANFIDFHRPDFFIINLGFFGPLSEQQGKEFKQTLLNLKYKKTRVIWKTTTPVHYGSHAIKCYKDDVALSLAAQSIWEVFDIGPVAAALIDRYVTRKPAELQHDADADAQWDALHYHCWVYKEFNILLANMFIRPPPRGMPVLKYFNRSPLPFIASSNHSENRIIKNKIDRTIFLFEKGYRRPFKSFKVFEQKNYSLTDIYPVDVESSSCIPLGETIVE